MIKKSNFTIRKACFNSRCMLDMRKYNKEFIAMTVRTLLHSYMPNLNLYIDALNLDFVKAFGHACM